MISSGIFVFLLALTCLSLATAETLCPYNVAGCTCFETSVTCLNLQELPHVVNGYTSGISVVYFRDGNITSIPDNSLPPGLTDIAFKNHPLTSISENAFKTTENSLLSLSIFGASFRKLPKAILNLPALNTLDIEDTLIKDWGNDTLKFLGTSLTSLQLTNIGLSSWNIGFSFPISVTDLTLGNENLTTIPRDAFNSIKSTLNTLSLSWCELTKLPEALSSLTNLTSLDITHNKLTDVNHRPGIDQLAFLPLAKTLTSLNLDSIGLIVIPDLTNLTYLTTLTINYNNISNSNIGSLPKSLITVDLTENNLLSVPSVITNLTKLNTLYLSGNKIKDTSSSKFPSSLSHLDLSDNNINTLTDKLFGSPSSLVLLDLGFNPISTISPTAFTNMAKLRILYLNDVNLVHIPIAFTSLTSLTSMRIWNHGRGPACPCPTPSKLVSWYKSLNITLASQSVCSNGQEIDSYMRSFCQINTSSSTHQPIKVMPTILYAVFIIGYAIFFFST